MQKTTVLGQPSYRIASDLVQGWLAEAGGQFAPVSFQLGDRTVEPMHVAPWAEEDLGPDQPQIIKTLRGDFFCMPFGGAPSEFRCERHPVHGETANRLWEPEEAREGYLRLSIETTVRPGKVVKEITLKHGETNVYDRHTIHGNHGPMTFGHHAMLHFKGKGLISVSPFGFGQVFPGEFEKPEEGGYAWLKPGARFDSLERVPAIDGSTVDLTVYPSLEGWENLVTVYSEPGRELAWSAVAFPEEGYCWFSLKDPRVLTATVFWISNRGRHYAPWNGRHGNVYALEDVTSSIPPGIGPSSEPNEASKEGYRTFFELGDEPLAVSTIMGLVAIPQGFDHVASIEPEEGGVRITSRSGPSVYAKADLGHLR